MLKFVVDPDRCTRCGWCVKDCPSRIIAQAGAALPAIAPDDEVRCIQCQHCLAVCPTAAVSILGRNPDASLPVTPEVLPTFTQMARFARSRRSVRHYRDENVDPAVLRELLAAAANAPTGVNRRALTFTVIDDKDVMQRFRDRTMAALVAAQRAGRIPERFAYLEAAVVAHIEHQADVIFRGAPHALVVSAPPDAPCPGEDVPLALAYFELLAQSAGLGTVWWGMLRLVFAALPELKPLIGVPEGHHYYGMLFGRPAVRYPRAVQRDDAAVVRRIRI